MKNNKSPFSSGPWYFNERGGLPAQKALSGRYFRSVKSRPVPSGTIHATAFGNTPEEADSNAALIAAAPEMYEALLECLRMLELNGIGNGSTAKRAAKAIKKATDK